MTDLVYMKDGKRTTSSVIVAEHFGKRHADVVKSIESIIARNNCLPEDIRKSSFISDQFTRAKYKDAAGRSRTMYRMNYDGFAMLVMGFNGEEAHRWKTKFIIAFNMLAENAKVRGVEKLLRRTMTDEIRDSGENERMHGFGYKQYTDLVYKTVTGKTAKQLRDDLGLKKTDSVKEHLDPAQVEAIGKLERMIGGMVAVGLTYQAVKEAIGMATVKELGGAA